MPATPITTTSPAPLTEYDQQQLRGECEVFDRTGGLTLIFTGRLTITDPAYQILAG